MKGAHPVALLCEVLGVSRSGYYRWQIRRPTPRQREDEQLSAKIIATHARSRRNYGAPRVVAELRDEGTPISKRRCARLMKAHALRGRKKHRRRPRTTDSDHGHAPAANLLAQQPAPSGPNQAWMTDITYIETAEGWLCIWPRFWMSGVDASSVGRAVPRCTSALSSPLSRRHCVSASLRKACFITPIVACNTPARTTPRRCAPRAWFAA